MLLTSFTLLLAAAVFGIVLASVHLGAGRQVSIPWPVWSLHAALGVVGFGVLLASLGGPPHGQAMGVSGFGRIAAIALGAALLAAAPILASRLRRARVSVLTVGLHATLAIGGVVILAAYAMMG